MSQLASYKIIVVSFELCDLLCQHELAVPKRVDVFLKFFLDLLDVDLIEQNFFVAVVEELVVFLKSNDIVLHFFELSAVVKKHILEPIDSVFQLLQTINGNDWGSITWRQ